MSIRNLFFVLLLSTLSAAGPLSADENRYELGVMVGHRTGSATLITPVACIQAIGAPCPTDPEIQDGESFGLVFGVPVGERWSFEILLDHQNPDLELAGIGCAECNTASLSAGEAKLTTLHLGARHRWRLARVHPFVSLGIGATRVALQNIIFGLFDIDQNRASASLSAGLDVPIHDWLGLRFEARGYWIDLPTDLFESDEDLVQSQLAVGLTFSW